MSFFGKSEESIKEQLFAEVRKNLETLKITNFNPGGIFRGFLEVVAHFKGLIYKTLDKTFLNAFAATASGIWLDAKCRDVNVQRQPAQAAKGYFLFTRDNNIQNIKIKKGSLIKTELDINGKEFLFQTLEEVILPGSQADILIKVGSLEDGAHNNIAPGTRLLLVSSISGIAQVSCRHDWIIEPGADEESDESLRNRYFYVWRGLNVASPGYYLSLAKSVAGVNQVEIFRTARGAGTTDIVITSQTGSPSSSLLQKVQNVINEKALFDGVDIQVVAPVAVPVILSMELLLYSTPVSSTELIQGVRAVIVEFARGLTIGEDFVVSRLKMMVLSRFPSIKDVKLSAESNITSSIRQIIELDIMDITYRVEEK